MSKHEFLADEVFIKQRKLDKSWVVELSTGELIYDQIKDLPKLQGKVLKVTIEENN